MAPHASRVSLEQLRRAAARTAAELPCRLIVLFGSAARGPAPGDLDIGILGDSALDTVRATNCLIQAVGTQAVDVTDLGRADPLLLMLAARDGVPLYEQSPGTFNRFVSLAARRYADTRKFREAERQEVRDFIARSGTSR